MHEGLQIIGDPVIASNGYLGITKFDDEHSRLKTTSNNYWKKVHWTTKGEPYFIEHGIRYYLSDFFKLTKGATC